MIGFDPRWFLIVGPALLFAMWRVIASRAPTKNSVRWELCGDDRGAGRRCHARATGTAVVASTEESKQNKGTVSIARCRDS
jgi:hypothetical protein